MNVAPLLPYFDAHAHLQARQFDADRPAVLARARDAGLSGLICAGDDELSSRAAVALANAEQNVWATVGIHPHEARHAAAATLDRLEQLARDPRVVAWGEIGLDFFRDLSPRPRQRDLFEQQLALAAQLNLPVVIHSRDAQAETMTMLSAWRAGAGSRLGQPGQIHCFDYDLTCAQQFVALGFVISIPGTVTYLKREHTQAVAATVPLDMLTVETDSPYLTPQSRRGQRNEPAWVVETIRRIASLREMDAKSLGEMTSANARRLFRLPAQAGSVPVSPVQSLQSQRGAP